MVDEEGVAGNEAVLVGREIEALRAGLGVEREAEEGARAAVGAGRVDAALRAVDVAHAAVRALVDV